MSLEALWQRVEQVFILGPDSIHGPSHWRRVEQFGLLVAASSGADPDVVRMFALFHDAMRDTEASERFHGRKGADLACSLRGQGTFLDALDDGQFELLITACRRHTDGRTTGEPTVGTCWDADRLDLPRCAIWPKPRYLSTEAARELVSDPGYYWASERRACW